MGRAVRALKILIFLHVLRAIRKPLKNQYESGIFPFFLPNNASFLPMYKCKNAGKNRWHFHQAYLKTR